ncbi:MAG: sugar ABC transporter permease [Ardenticatenaceae bacterium]|nr:sugar ABC transporter permease [Ardenticatenaceae bacterium]HBY95730.1 ABC transporter permease [Chloroflexota bacterium]
MAVTPSAETVSRTVRTVSRERSEQLTAWLFMAPAVILLLIFLITPFLMAFGLSFTDQRLIPNPRIPTQFVGMRNFVRMLQDATFLRGLLNNFLFAVIVVPVQTTLALLLAILVNQRIRSVNLFRTMYFVPVVVPMVVVAVIWTFLYNPGAGTINAFIQAISGGRFGPYDWLGSTTLAFPAIMVLSIWQGVGFQMVIYLAGLQEINAEVYEASAIDGVNKFQEFFYITVPMLRNTTIFVVISTTILAFKLFTQVDVMTSGGPQDATMTTVLHVVNQGFRELRVGYASALTITFFLIVLAISLVQRVFLQEERAVQ